MADDDHSYDRNVPINSDHVASLSFSAAICDKLSVPDTPFHCQKYIYIHIYVYMYIVK